MDNAAFTAELRTRYRETVQWLNRFTLSTLAILVVLALIVQQRLLEDAGQSKAFRRDVIGLSHKQANCRKDLSESYFAMRRSAGIPRVFHGLQDFAPDIDRLARPTGRGQLNEDGLKAIQAVHAAIAERLRAESESRRIAREAGKPVEARDEQAQAIGALEPMGTTLKRYEVQYRKCVETQERMLDKRSELEKVRLAKQAVPTPFGNFEVPATLALVALSFAALLLYIWLLASIAKLYEVVRQYPTDWRPRSLLPLAESPSVWLFAKGHGALATLFAEATRPRLRATLNIALHLSWLTLAMWLVFQSLNARPAGVLLINYKSSIHVALAVLALAALILALFAAWSLPAAHAVPTLPVTPRRLGKREFLVAVVGILAAGSTYWLVSSFAGKRKRQRAPMPSSVRVDDERFVLNGRTRVLHHAKVCRGHLPVDTHAVPLDASSGIPYIHAGYSARILDEFARSAAFRGDEQAAAAAWISAIEASPASIHLYDRLVGLYGRLKQYDRIEPLLLQAIQNFQQMKQQASTAPKPSAARMVKRAERSERALQSRLEAYKHRRQRAEARNSIDAR
jgi:hypothetical protein